jgi:hypothetical protein
MHVTRTDHGTTAYPRSILLSREGTAARLAESASPSAGGSAPADTTPHRAEPAWLARLHTEPAVRAEVVAAARAAVASGEILTQRAALAAAEGFLNSLDTFSA